MKNSYFHYYQPKALLILIVALTIGLYLGSAHLGIQISIVSAITGFLFLIDRYWWKYRPFSYCFWTKDFSGRYEGCLEYEFLNADCEKQTDKLKHLKIIHQTGSSIKISSFTYDKENNPSSKSENIVVTVNKGEDGNFSLIYTYLNEGNAAQAFPPHHGTEIVKIIGTGKKKCLSGIYYTNRIPQTRGKLIDLKYINNNLEHPF